MLSRAIVRFIVVVCLCLTAGCTSWQTRETPHFLIKYEPHSPASKDIEDLAILVENHFSALYSIYGYQPPRKIPYYFHNQFPLRFFGDKVWGYVCMGKVHVIYHDRIKDRSPHELRHHVQHRVNPKAPNFFDEGSANIDVTINKRSVHQIAKSQGAQDIPLQRFERYVTGFEAEDELAEIVAYSFCTFLYNRGSRKQFGDFYKSVTSKNYRQLLQRVYGKSLDHLVSEWKSLLRKAELWKMVEQTERRK